MGAAVGTEAYFFAALPPVSRVIVTVVHLQLLVCHFNISQHHCFLLDSCSKSSRVILPAQPVLKILLSLHRAFNRISWERPKAVSFLIFLRGITTIHQAPHHPQPGLPASFLQARSYFLPVSLEESTHGRDRESVVQERGERERKNLKQKKEVPVFSRRDLDPIYDFTDSNERRRMAALKSSTKRLNVLVYSGAQTYSDWRNNILTDSSGNGTTVDSVRQCLYTLRRLLSPNYAVIPVTGEMIIKEPWTATCALLVMPGGADLPYCRTLNGEGNRKIRQFVQLGGTYLGFCAGGYFGSARCEFEVGNKILEVVGSRELAFFPGTCRGCAFPGFVYHSEDGARAADLKVSKEALGTGSVPDNFKSYYNGGGVFVDAPKYADKGVEVLASYAEPLAVDPGEGAAAVVYCPIGEGAAILTGPHPEYVTAQMIPTLTAEGDLLTGYTILDLRQLI